MVTFWMRDPIRSVAIIVPSKWGASVKHRLIVLKIDMEDGAKEREKEVNKEESEREPPKPVVERCEWDLPANENIVIVLFYESGKNEEEEKESACHSRPPHKPLSQNYCHLHSL